MAALATTKMTSKGQIVIPEGIRKHLGLKNGVQFVVMGEKDVVILKTIKQPSLAEFKPLLKKTRKYAKDAGMKKTDITEAIKKARSKH